MLSFKDFLTEELITEVLNSEFTIHHDKELKNRINRGLRNKVFPGHTAIMSSDHMNKHGLQVLRLKNTKHEVEYHLLRNGSMGKLPPEQQDTKALLHSLKIIKDDSKKYLDRGSKIKLQSSNKEQHEVYKKLSNHLTRPYSDRSVKDLGLTPRMDGNGSAHTLMIESESSGAINWFNFIKRDTLTESNIEYMYHATNMDNVHDILDSRKIKTHKPSHGTDQTSWPDGSTKKRSYWTHDEKTLNYFYPEHGTPKKLRVPKNAHTFKRESTGDHYLEKDIPIDNVEIHHKGEWKPLSSFS